MFLVALAKTHSCHGLPHILVIRTQFHGSAYRKHRIREAGNYALTPTVFHGLAVNFGLWECIHHITRPIQLWRMVFVSTDKQSHEIRLCLPEKFTIPFGCVLRMKAVEPSSSWTAWPSSNVGAVGMKRSRRSIPNVENNNNNKIEVL